MDRDAELQVEVDELRARLAALEARLRRWHRSGRAPGSELEVLFVRVLDLLGAFELAAVREVVPAALLAPLPEAPAWVLGTLNLRGVTIPVVDVSSRLRGATPELSVADVIVIVATEFGTAGVVVSEVGAIRNVTLDEQAALLETPHAAYVVGTFSCDGQARLLLGVQELLRHSDLASLVARERGLG
jgi:purine-binding chemotaxis protein CheW